MSRRVLFATGRTLTCVTEANSDKARFPMKSLTSRLAGISALALLVTGLATGVAYAVANNWVPWHGTAVGAITVFNPTPAGVEITVTASGHANQLGHFDRVEHLLLNPVSGQIVGTIDFTAANGDILRVDVVGGITGPGVIEGTYTVLGATSTGRFAGASGGADFVALNPDEGPVSVSFDGHISKLGG